MVITPGTKVVMKQLVAQMAIQTDKTGTMSYLQVDLPGTEEWGPYLESIQALTVTINSTANLYWDCICSWTNDGVNVETPFTSLTGGITDDGQTVESAVTSGFGGRLLRFAIGCKNSAGTELESGVISVWLVFTFKT